jgi:hypothetical protein
MWGQQTREEQLLRRKPFEQPRDQPPKEQQPRNQQSGEQPQRSKIHRSSSHGSRKQPGEQKPRRISHVSSNGRSTIAHNSDASRNFNGCVQSLIVTIHLKQIVDCGESIFDQEYSANSKQKIAKVLTVECPPNRFIQKRKKNLSRCLVPLNCTKRKQSKIVVLQEYARRIDFFVTRLISRYILYYL